MFSQARRTEFISLPLLKHSSSTNAESDKVWSWTHTTGKLCLVAHVDIEPADGSQKLTLIEVMQDGTAMERVLVEELVREAFKAKEAAHVHRITLRNVQLPVLAMTRSPMIAMRYRLSNHKIRRFQVRFSNEKDYQIALNLLQRAKCPTEVAAPKENAKPGPSCPPSSLQPVIATAPVQRPVASEAAPVQLTPATYPIETSSMRIPLKPEINACSNTAPLILSTDHRSIERPNNTYTLQHQHPHTHPAKLNNLHIGSQNMSQTINGAECPPVSNLCSTEVPRAAYQMDDARPATAPVPSSPDHFALAPPPRRDLPFKRPTTHRPNLTDDPLGSSRPSSSVDLPPLPAPTYANKSRGPSKLAQVPQIYHSLGPQSETSSTLRPSSSVSGSKVPRNANVEDVQTHPKTSSSACSMTTSFVTAKTQLQAPISTSATERALALDPTETEFAQRVERVTSAIENAPDWRPGGDWRAGRGASLEAYAMLPTEQRHAILDDFFLSHLFDDDFLKLCEDVENCWKRIALGL